MRLLTFILGGLLTVSAFSRAQQVQHGAETTSEVPALTNFHTVIYAIWHDAWPKKDMTQLADLLPKIEAGVKEISDATLPGILRDKKDAWDAQVKGLQSIAGEYRSAVDRKESQQLLDAAERLHMQYEKLARAIRPALKELEDFHAELYVLYHYYMPGDSIARMQESAIVLKKKMAILNGAELPGRLKAKEQMFTTARNDLYAAVEAFAAIAPKGDVKDMRSSVGTLHEKYEKLDDLLTKQ